MPSFVTPSLFRWPRILRARTGWCTRKPDDPKPGDARRTGSVLFRPGNLWMPTSVPPLSQTTWWEGPVSSSTTGSGQSKRWYQGRLRPRSLTVRATCVIAGNSAIIASVRELCRKIAGLNLLASASAPDGRTRADRSSGCCSGRHPVLPLAFSGKSLFRWRAPFRSGVRPWRGPRRQPSWRRAQRQRRRLRRFAIRGRRWRRPCG
jgi:hypothetical protein